MKASMLKLQLAQFILFSVFLTQLNYFTRLLINVVKKSDRNKMKYLKIDLFARKTGTI